MDISGLIKNARIRSGTTQSALARSLGVSRTTVSNWEKGRSMPDLVHFKKILDLLDLSDYELDTKCSMNFNRRIAKFNPAMLNAQGLSKLYEFYYELIRNKENLK